MNLLGVSSFTKISE